MEFRTASVISTGLHAAVLLWAVVSFGGKTFEVTPAESLPVDLMSEKDFTAMTKGSKTAPKAETPKPLVEKIAEPKPTDTTAPKVSEKKEIQPTADKPPEPKPPEKKEAKAETKPEPPKPEETKPDPIAEKLKKEETKKDTASEQKKPDKPEKKQPKFDASKIAALLDKRDPTRNAATGDTLNSKPTLGHVNGTAAKLSMSEIDAFKNRMRECWNPPIGMDRAQEMVVLFHVQFNLDGSVKTGPDIIGGRPDPSGPAFAESARRALLQCQPYTMFRKDTYDQWNDMEVGFNSKEMFRD
jgi:colicin import membrane protein